MKELVMRLNQASEAYYAEDSEIMSNYEYDRLYDELTELEKETGVILSNSPTVRVGYEAVDDLPKERHEKPMLSLGKTKSREELRDWLNEKDALLSWKIDHCADLFCRKTCKGGDKRQWGSRRSHHEQCESV